MLRAIRLRSRGGWLARRRFLLLGLAALSLLLWGCLASPVRELWPPRAGEPRYALDVVFRGWHTIVIEPVSEDGATVPMQAGEPPSAAAGFRESGYFEKAWYLENRQGCSGAVRALLWPTASGVGSETFPRPAWERFPESEVRRWSFVVSEKGLRAMHAYLESERGDPLPDFPGWHAGRHSYHFFHTCHHFTASALRAGGLPIRPWWAFTGWLTGLQLDRVRRFHQEEGLGPRAP